MSLKHRSGVMSLALSLAAVAGLGGLVTPAARADTDGFTISPMYYDDASPQPLMTTALNDAGAGKYLSQAGIKVGGYADMSWTVNTSDPHSPTIADRSFDFENEDPTFNGIGLFAEKAVDASQGKWDVGFRFDMLYGGDARFTHSNGMFDNRGFTFNAAQDGDTGPDEQFDITQAYIEVAVPWGHGLTLNIGKFITPIGYEYVDPTKNTLYSHGYLYNYGAPYSQTGITGKYSVSDQLTVMAGFTRGWDQSLRDNNGAIDFLGQVEYKPDSAWDTFLTLSTGPQESTGYGYRTELDALIYYTPDSSKWTFGGEAMYAIEADVPGTGDDYSQWYGAAVYPSYALCSHLSVNGRLEWFNDADGVRGVGANNAFEATLGLTFMPLADSKEIGTALKIRPEIRFDYADSPVFGGGDDYSQTTIAVDAVIAF